MPVNHPQTLMNRNFLLLWIGHSVSIFGSSFFFVAILFWMKGNTGSATEVGVLMMAATLPAMLLGPVGGTIADLFSRRTILIASDAINGAAMLFLAGILYIKGDNTHMIQWIMLVTAFLNGGLGALFRPAIGAALPDLVPKNKLLQANTLRQVSMRSLDLVGKALGGVAFISLGPLILFLGNGLSFLISALSECFIKIPQAIPKRNERGFKAAFAQFRVKWVEGLQFVRAHSALKNLFLGLAFVNFLFGPIPVLLPFYVEDFLQQSIAWYGYLMGSMTSGSLIGVAGFHFLALGPKTRGWFLIGIIPCLGLLMSLLGVWLNPWSSLVLFFLLGSLTGIFNLNIVTLIQATTPSKIRGRVMGLLETLSIGLLPMSMVVAGIIADGIGRKIPHMFLGYGAVLILVALVISKNREYRALWFFDVNAQDAKPLQVPA